MNERPKICTSFDDHDHEQLILLAKINKIKPSDLIRRICRSYLDKRPVKLPLEEFAK